MAWRDSLSRVTLPDGRIAIGASFRGATFFVESSDRTGGRRTVTHEFPGRDHPFVEDLGRRARVYTVEGYVVGDDYVAARDALLAALEDTSGPGELVHPYHGVRRAICASLTVRETRLDGRMAVFQIEFADAPSEPAAPTEEPDLAADVEDSSEVAIEANVEELEEDYDVDGQPSWALESLSKEIEDLADELDEALTEVATTTQEAAKASAEVRLLSQQAASLVRTPAQLMEDLLSALRTLADSVLEAPRPVVLALLDVYATVGVAAAPGDTATRKQERANQEALAGALRRLLLIEAARIATLVEYETIEDARDDATAIADKLEDQAATAGNTAYPALVELRARLLRAVPGDATLARALTVRRRVPVPSILLSYQLYGTVEQEGDLIARNRVRHPGFLAGDLEVLSNV